MWRMVIGKYKEVVAAIALFIALDAGVLLLNFYTSYQIADDTHAIQLASRQAMLSQRILQNIYQVRDDLRENRDFDTDAIKLAIPYKQFDEVLDSFIYGGALIGQGQGNDSLLIGDDYQVLSDTHLKEAERLWRPYRRLISPLVYAGYDSDTDRVELLHRANAAIEYAREHGDQLLESVQGFAVAVENKAQRKAERLRYIQAIGITLAVLNFFLILFHFLRKLGQSDSKAEKAQAETREILNTVNDGLFLLGNDYRIGTQYSASMCTLFKRKNFRNESFMTLLKPLVSEKILSVAQDYIDVLFNERVKSNLMKELNPLKEIEISLYEDGQFTTHYFNFDFSRVYENGQLIHLLVTVTDVTKEIELKRQLEQSEQRASQELELMLSVMHVDNALLLDFLQGMDVTLKKMNEQLEEPAFKEKHYRKKVDKIYRLTHRLKGDAAAIGLSAFENRLHSMEDNLSQLRDQPHGLEGNDFLTTAVHVNNLMSTAVSIKIMVERFSNLKGIAGGDESGTSERMINPKTSSLSPSPWQTLLGNLVTEVSKDYGKQVRLDLSRFNHRLIPFSASDTVKDTLIQFIRNAIAHGLEDTPSRLQQGKSPVGTISVCTRFDNGELILEVKDDGRGIDFEAVRSRLREKSKLTDAQIAQLTPSELIRFLFKPGFTTCSSIDRHAGRGVGLDLVKESLDELGASLSVGSKSHRFTEFKIRLPAHVHQGFVA